MRGKMNHKKPLKKKPIIESIQIEELSHDGRGIGRIDGKTIFIEGALPNERVSAEIFKKHSRYEEGKVTAIIEPAPIRIEPKCPHFQYCGGCVLQHINHDAQIHHKTKVLKDHLEHFGQIEPKTWLPPVTGQIWNYRHKARLTAKFVTKKNSVLVGFREKNSHLVADIEQCPILAKPVDSLITKLKILLNQFSIKSHIPQIEIAIGDNVIAFVIRILQKLSDADEFLLKNFAEQEKIVIHLQPGGYDTVYQFWPEHPATDLTFSVPRLNLTYAFKPIQFSQVNPEINTKMIELVLQKLNPLETDNILDLFCGFGNFTLAIAKMSLKVCGIEGNANAIEQARFNAQLNQLTHCQFEVANLEQDFEHMSWAKPSYDKILIDPPRSGAEKIMHWLLHKKPKLIIYISCNPATLARDLKILTQNSDYLLEEAGILDMFPHTKHVESIAVLKRVKP